MTKVKHPKTKRTVVAPPAPEPRPLDKLLAAQKALEQAEREYGNHDWLSSRQKYRTLDQIDETMEELVHDARNAPGLHIFPALPDLTATTNLLLTVVRGRLMRKLNLQSADKEMRHQLGLDR